MADQIPPAQLQRTITHMNKDHQLDLQHILQHFNSLPAAECTLPEMLDLSFTTLTVRVPSTNKTHTVALFPPLEKWEDRRSVLVGMTHTAREALGIPSASEEQDHSTPDIVIKEFFPPRPFDWIIFFSVLAYYFIYLFVQQGYFNDGTGVAQWLDTYWLFPGILNGSKGFKWLTETIFWLVVGIHVAEASWLERSRLSKFGVKRGGKVWWLWMGSCFVEGAMAFKRFDILVERERKVKGKKTQ
ncbi:hypothetical protein QBC38DRAFT_473752 [Podospora fimiseda]|uniref:DUF2470 domain-containing protein n=1 Tax=Podospora fimiseda TaxID=252190 RepID=A0AAN7H1U3_9PEZI|nr:hypothetical protein QBC38DRAFT_473752 [Podospora fimiseda]